jgi:hypothetical protein
MYNEHILKEHEQPIYNKRNIRKKQNVINNQTLKSNSNMIIIYVILMLLVIAVIILAYFLHKLTKRYYISDRKLFETTEQSGYNTITKPSNGILHNESKENYKIMHDGSVSGHYDIIYHTTGDITFDIIGVPSGVHYKTSQEDINTQFMSIDKKTFIHTRIRFHIHKYETTNLSYRHGGKDFQINQISIHYKDYGLSS